MKTIKKVNIEPVFVEEIPKVLEENKLYISKIHKTIIHNCLCGCGKQSVTPLEKDGWNLIENEKGVSLTPSIGNWKWEKPHHAHYIITNNVANFV